MALIRIIFLFYISFLTPVIAQKTKTISEDITPNSFSGTDTERIQKAINAATKAGKPVKIGYNAVSNRSYWSIDKALLLPSNTTVLLENCTLQLSDQSRDNLFRSDNVGEGITAPEWNTNIHIYGTGNVTLKGANNPRSTGDSGRQLTMDPDAEQKKGNWRVSYGTDAQYPDRKQTGDWRNIMILMGYVKNFTLENVRVENSHAWAISFERTHHAKLQNLVLHNPETLTINNREVKVFNKDGIDLRQGCKYFTIHNVSGFTGDDFIALSSLDVKKALDPQNGSINSTMVTKSRWMGPEDDIEQITISSISCETICRAVAIRASDSASIHHVYITGLISHEAEGVGGKHNALLIGGKGYGAPSEDGKIHHIFANQIITNGYSPIHIEAPIHNCHFMNILYTGKNPNLVNYAIEKELTKNVNISYSTGQNNP